MQEDLEEKARLEEEEKIRKEKEIIENNKREAEIHTQKRETRINIENGRARIIINDKMDLQLIYGFTRWKRNIIEEDLKQFDKVIIDVKNRIIDQLNEKVEELVKNGIDELNEKRVPYLMF